MGQLIVQKYGGASLLNTEKLVSVAQSIIQKRRDGHQIVVVVSAMGRATDEILAAMKSICSNPEPREMDLALSTGETISAAMLTTALIHHGCDAISFTAQQAGIITDNVHSIASIHHIEVGRIKAELNRGKVVVIPGFQGTNRLGETTTLGRGGSDSTAVAIAAAMSATRCEILKEVAGIFTANPNVVADARPIATMGYRALLDMTFWGAKVLNYRSVEIASFFSVPLYVGLASEQKQGTMIKDELMIQVTEVVSLNSHETVLKLRASNSNISNAVTGLRMLFAQKKITFPQILHAEMQSGNTDIYLTAPIEILNDIRQCIFEFTDLCETYSTITATCRGTTKPALIETMAGLLDREGIVVFNVIVSSSSVTLFVDPSLHSKALNILHKIINRALK